MLQQNFTTTAAFTLYITNESQPLHFRFMISRPDARETGGKLLSLAERRTEEHTKHTHSCRQLYRRTFLLNHCTLIRNCPSLPPRVHFRCESARVHFRPSTNNNEDGTDVREKGGWGSRGTRNGFTTFRVRFDHLCVCPNLTCSHSP